MYTLQDLLRGSGNPVGDQWRSGPAGILGGNYSGVNFANGMPQPLAQSRAPSIDLNTAAGRGFLGMTLGAGGQGYQAQGVSAFMPHGWQLDQRNGSGNGSTAAQGGMDGSYGNLDGTSNASIGQILSLAQSMGYDTSKYNLGDAAGLSTAGRLPGSIQDSNSGSGLAQMYLDMNNQLKDYTKIGGLSAGWDGQDMAKRSASDTIYQTGADGVMRAVSNPESYTARTNPGWVKGEGADMIAAASLMMPAFGGWAGMLGNGASGTLSAGSGLGLTSGLSGAIGTGATNALVNAGMAGLQGGGVQGALGSLIGAGANAAGSQLMGGGGLSNMFNTANAAAPTQFNPFSQFASAAGRTLGADGAGIGQIAGLAGRYGSYMPSFGDGA